MPSSLSAGIFRAVSFPSHLRSPFLHPKKKDPSSILHGSVLKVTDTVYRRIPASNSILTYSIMYRCRVGRNGVARSRIANWRVGIRSSIASFAGGERKWAEGGVVEVDKSEGSRQERSSHHPHLQHQLLTEEMEEEKDGGYKQPQPQQQLGVSYSKLLTLPTVLTLGRVAAIPLLVTTYHMNGSWATTTTTGIFLLAAFTDWLDGYLARKMRLGSIFGAFLDPVADKLMVATTLVLLCTEPLDVAFFGVVPWILTVPAIAIIGREITMSAVREWAASQNNRVLEAVAVNNLGKWKTATQMTALSILLFTRDPSSFLGTSFLVSAGVLLLYISAGLALCSLAVYMRNIWRFLIK